MGAKSTLLLMLFVGCCGAALVNPLWGVLGYVTHYNMGPEHQWWGRPLANLGIRLSFTLGAITGASMLLNWGSLRFGRRLLIGHEKLILLFLALAWAIHLLSETTVGRYTTVDHPVVKFTKVVLFLMMLTHIVTTQRRLDWLIWGLIIGALILGLEAYDTPRSQFAKGRLDRVGGPDFREANYLAAYLVAMLPLIGAQFFRSGWAGKVLCLGAGAFAANAVVLTRSRGGVVAIAAGSVATLVMAPRRHRGKILIGLIVAALGFYYLSDPQFRARALTIARPGEQRDVSSESRIQVWRGAVRMLAANPLGVGVGNFYQNIGRYAPDQPGRDAHSTYLRCACEIGLQGLAVFIALLISAFMLAKRAVKRAQELPTESRTNVEYLYFGMVVSLWTFLGSFITMSLIYMEGMWWVLALPVCLYRVVENALEDETAAAEKAKPRVLRKRRQRLSRVPAG